MESMENKDGQDDVGMARIEQFLDRIEDPHESILESFQNDFEIIKESLGMNDVDKETSGSSEYEANKLQAEKWDSDAGSVTPNKEIK